MTTLGAARLADATTSGGTAIVTVRAVRPGEEAALRELRLRALTDSPHAFASTAGREASQPESYWVDLAGPGGPEPDAGVVCVAVDGTRWVGMAGGRWFDRERGIAQLWGMWVEPAWRGRGFGERLVAAIHAWAAGHGARFVRLGVIVAPGHPSPFYERLGFVFTGEERPLPLDPARRAWFLARPV